MNFLSEILLGEISFITQVGEKATLKPTEKMGGREEETGKVDHSLKHFDTEGGKKIRDLEKSRRAWL